MPRIYTSASDPVNFCLECFPSEEEALEIYGNVGDGPDGRGNCFGYDEEHPPYEHEEYTCADCKKELTGYDDYRT